MKWPVVTAATLILASGAAIAQPGTVTIGTGSATGVYQVAGDAICRLLNREAARHGLRCVVRKSDGSVHNVNAIRNGEFDFGIVQSDVQYHAVKGQGPFRESGPDTDLRAVFSVYPEPLMVFARNRSEIERFEDFKGKRFNVGKPGSGTRATVDMLLKALDMKPGDFAQATELSPDDHGPALCDNRIDGFGYVVGNPAASLQYPTRVCNARLIPLTGAAIDRMVVNYPYFAFTTIPGGLYPANREPVRTFGVVATLVTSARVPDEAVHAVVAAVFDHFDEFRKQHPSFAHLQPTDAINSGLTAPLHNGALRYFREKGLVRRGD